MSYWRRGDRPLFRELRWSLQVRAQLRAARRRWSRVASDSRSSNPPIEANPAARLTLVAVTGLYVAAFSYLTVRTHRSFGTYGFDLGIFHQGVWLLSDFREPFVTVRGLHLFGDHTSFVLILLVPLYWIVDSAAALLVAQSLALGAGAIATFLIGREKLSSEWLAFSVAAAYLANPVLQWTNFDQFHPDALEVPLVLFAIYFMIKSRWIWFAVCIGLVLLVKEDTPLLAIALGVYVAVCHHRKVGALTANVSLAWLLVAFYVVLPAFNEGGSLYTGRVFERFGGFGGFLEAAFTRPWEIASLSLSGERRHYLWQLLVPMAFLPLLAPRMLMLAIGPLAINLLTVWPYAHDIRYHYSTLILPVLTTATIFAISRFAKLSVRRVLVAATVVAGLVGCYLWGPLPIAREPAALADPSTPYASAVRGALELIPSSAAVSADPEYVPHLTDRPRIFEFPNPWRATNWGNATQDGMRLPDADEIDHVLIREGSVDASQTNRDAIIDHLRKGGFVIVYQQEGVLLLRRTH